MPVAPYNPRNTNNPLGIEYHVQVQIENYSKDIQFKKLVLYEMYNCRTQVERTIGACKDCGLGMLRARDCVHARTKAFFALCLQLVIAMTNDERRDNPGSAKTTV